MDPLSITASVIAILQLTRKVIEYLDNLKDAPRDRAHLVIEASNLYTLLITLKYRLEGGSNEAWHTAVRSLGVQNGPLHQYKEALEQLQHKIVGGSGLKKIGNVVMWKFNKEEVAGILSKIERLKGLIHIALEMDHFKLSEELKRCMDDIHSDNNALRDDMTFVRSQIPTLQDGVDELQTRMHDVHLQIDHQRHHMLMEWISSTNFPSQQSDQLGRKQAGTGQWFLNSPTFIKWLNGPKETLFCPGIPGAGKTMMTTITIDHISQIVQNDTGLAYVYCNYKDQAEQNAVNLLAAVLKQLLQGRASIAEPVSRLYGHHSRRMTKPSLEEIFTSLQTVLKNFSTVYILVDALDECSNHHGARSQLFAKLRDLQQQADLRLMFTSRFIPEIENLFKSMPSLEIRANDADVKKFVRGQINRLPKCIQRDIELQKLVEDKIVEAVDGMFLLARLHMDPLLDKRTKAKVKSTLEELSTGSESLNKAYDDAVKRIDSQLPQDSVLAKTALSWTTYAQRSLRTTELCHALAVEPGKEDLDEDNIPDIEDVVSVCAGLITVDRENIVRLVHYTTQEYFEAIGNNWNPTAQQEIATTCLTYLSFTTFRSGSCPTDEEYEHRLEQNRFLQYAAQYWGEHSRTVQEQVWELATSFLQNADLISSSMQALLGPSYMGGFRNYSQYFTKQVTGVHLAVKFGLPHLLMKLLSRLEGNPGIFADAVDMHGRTPLSWAAEQGQEVIVKLLVERDDVVADSKDVGGKTPLSWAAGQGQEVIVKLLVERDDVNADSRDRGGWTPLVWATMRGHEAVVKVLVSRDDVDVNSRDVAGRTVVEWATSGENWLVLGLLGSKLQRLTHNT